jgi:hypothetical protein
MWMLRKNRIRERDWLKLFLIHTIEVGCLFLGQKSTALFLIIFYLFQAITQMIICEVVLRVVWIPARYGMKFINYKLLIPCSKNAFWFK